MDDQNKNLIVAAVLSFLVILGWTYLVPQTPTVNPDDLPPAASDSAPVASSTGASVPRTADATTATTAAPAPADAPRLKIETPRLAGSVSLIGGSIDDLSLKDYRETIDAGSADVRLLSYGGTPSASGEPAKPYFANYGWIAGAGVSSSDLPGRDTLWTVESGTAVTPGQAVVLAWDNGKGLTFRRKIEVDTNYMFTVTQSVENHTAAPVTVTPYGLILREGTPKTYATYVAHEGAIRMTDGVLREVTYKKMPKLDTGTGEGADVPAEVLDAAQGGWVGFTDKYWMTTLVPMPGQPFTSVLKYLTENDTFEASARMPAQEIAPGASASTASMLFAGAKEWEVIRAYQNDLKIDRFVDAIDWGWFFFLTKPMFWLLHHLHGWIGNMGLAIISLTFIIKTLVFPLARKSYISMAKMKELQPEIEALKERVGDDRMKVQQEMMALYKREKVSPASGCLPMFIQIPIFYSLYKVIYGALELRQAPFFGWLRDLSAPDPSSVLNLFGTLPWAAPDHASFLAVISLGLLPILLGISMWFQQKLNPAPTDPAQATVFAWMPWVFMFMLGKFASGLVLYWITNNTITFVQQYTIMTMHGKRPDIFGNIKSSVARKKPAAK